MSTRWPLLAALSMATTLSCADNDEAASDKVGAGDLPGADGGVAFPPGASDNAGGPAPEENTGDVDFDQPLAGKSVVFVPNSVTNRVAVVHAQDFQVETFSSGLTPRAVAVVPGEDIALVVNEGSLDVSLVRTVDGASTLQRIPIGHPINAVAIAPDGRHALVYFAAEPGANGADTHQDASVLTLDDEPRVWAISVGFRPRAVRFDSAGEGAFVITEDGVSSVLFDDAADVLSVAQIAIGVGLGTSAADVLITSDGAYAVARSEGRSELTLVDLATRESVRLEAADLAGPSDAGIPDAGADGGSDAGADGGSDAGADGGAGPNLDLSDLDLSPDGTRAYAVLRGTSTLLEIPLPAGFSDPSAIRRVSIGEAGVGALRVAPDGALGVLYSSVSALEGVLLADLRDLTAPLRAVRLRKTVRAVAVSADAAHLFVLHRGAQSGGVAGGNAFTASEGFSLVAVDDGFAKFEPTTVPIRDTDLVVSPDGTRVFSLLRGNASTPSALLTSGLETLRTERTSLARLPTSLGIVPDLARVFVGQESEGGMITFLDQDGQVERTLSGFELASKVRQ